jgi:hypothetical protein
MKPDPEVSELLKKKQERRRQLAKLPFEEKIKIVRQLQQLSKSIRNSRDAKDRDIINRRHEELNKEAMDVLDYQTSDERQL